MKTISLLHSISSDALRAQEAKVIVLLNRMIHSFDRHIVSTVSCVQRSLNMHDEHLVNAACQLVADDNPKLQTVYLNQILKMLAFL